ncbi:hypothetical protein OG252_42835 [Streptomyces sp. NBC_01352]|uniref:hypothetical protein n=1 Tax=unclassified Streptomyces TaxID=2593676 RepID=UPI00224D400B|nr:MULTISPECIES: hypothetical protein [unclassified Streptomyces]MCX4702676.1 hypothetical protein [Streptomyces sp. NBC_01373]
MTAEEEGGSSPSSAVRQRRRPAESVVVLHDDLPQRLGLRAGPVARSLPVEVF